MSRLLLCDVRGPVEDLLQKLSGEDGSEWLEATKKFLRKENPWPEPANLPVVLNWKAVGQALGM
ncbi:MAG: hypothetical protein FJZ43_00730 [Candidatus Staskawiczbacteria bacterium]|nr:hypothetical protein [Candidatus Staskawiczbacteria bacterium]